MKREGLFCKQSVLVQPYDMMYRQIDLNHNTRASAAPPYSTRLILLIDNILPMGRVSDTSFSNKPRGAHTNKNGGFEKISSSSFHRHIARHLHHPCCRANQLLTGNRHRVCVSHLACCTVCRRGQEGRAGMHAAGRWAYALVFAHATVVDHVHLVICIIPQLCTHFKTI